MRDLGPGDTLRIDELGVTIEVSALYDGVLPLEGEGSARGSP